MSQSDLTIEHAGVGGPEFAADLQAALRAVGTLQKGPSAPPKTFPGLAWLDDSGAPWILRLRNGADDDWIEILRVDDSDDTVTLALKALTMSGAILAVAGTQGAPGIAFAGDADTGMRHPAANELALVAGGIDAVRAGATFAELPLAVRFGGVLTPPQINAQQNDYNPAGLASASHLRLSTDATRTITGLAGGVAGRSLLITNVGANAAVLAHESTSSSAANRFLFGSGQDLSLAPGQSVLLRYDAVTARWRREGEVGAASTGPEVQEFSNSGTWTKPAGKTVALVEGIGGGGAGAAHGDGGGGGGGGSYVAQWFQLAPLGSSETVTIGAGATGEGGNGGNTTFGGHLTAYGGAGGADAAQGAGGGSGLVRAGFLGFGDGGASGGGGIGQGHIYGGGGGGGGDATSGGPGGRSIHGGGGGGGGSDTSLGGGGGASLHGGNGGNGANGSNNAQAGQVPGGGGGGAKAGNFGSGAKGWLRVTAF